MSRTKDALFDSMERQQMQSGGFDTRYFSQTPSYNQGKHYVHSLHDSGPKRYRKDHQPTQPEPCGGTADPGSA